MTFLAPWFLIGLLAAAIPLLLHLRRSKQTRPVPFSFTRFFDEQFLKATRRARLQDLLLMILRMALIALLALALAQPLLRSGPLAGLLNVGQAQRVVLVVDDSASMRRAGVNGTMLDHAKAQAQAIVASLSAARGDAAAVVLAGQREAGPVTLFDQLTTDLDAVRRAVASVQATDTGTDLGRAVATARRLAGGDPRTRIIVLSDMQASGWDASAADMAPDSTVLFIAVPAGPGGASHNLAVDAVQIGSARPMIGVPFTFRALLTNHDTRPHTRRVQLHAGDQIVATREVELPPQRGLIVRFVHRFTDPGWHACRIAFDATQEGDALAADDQRHVAVHVQRHLRVLAINGSPSAIAVQDELFFLAAALRAGRSDEQGVQLDVATPTDTDTAKLADYPVLVLANVGVLPDPVAVALRQYVDGGGSLLITGGDRYAGTDGLVPPAEVITEAAPLGEVDDAHAAVAGLDLRAGLQRLRIERRLDVATEDAQVLIAAADGSPLLIERRRGAGRVLQWTSTLDRDWTDLPVQPVFVPLVHRWLTYLAQPTLERGLFARTGDRVALQLSTWGQALPQVRRPDGELAYPVPQGPATAWLDDTTMAGVYHVGPPPGQADGQAAMMLAVNLPPQESALAPLSRDAVAATMPGDVTWEYVTASAGDVQNPALAPGAGLWDVLLVLALAAAVIEPWIANRWGRGRRSPTVAATTAGADLTTVAAGRSAA